jgi:tetratricopeptide (TPR) repeat protein
MICPNCGSNMSEKRKRCERCGVDLTIYKKVIRISNYNYNSGLAKAKVRDLSGAIIALRRSLDFNKKNTNARNLLGLIYYEMGEVVAALSEWVISRHIQPLDNDADEYINKVQSNPTKLDVLNQAIKRYNTALKYAKQGSDDLAIIQLKKVVSLNTHFIRAYQLLVLLHMKTGENEKAKKYLFKVGKIDVSNTLTLRYMQELESPAGKDINANPEAEQQSSITNTIIPISSYKEDKPNIMAFVNLVIGVIIGIAVTAILIIPTVKKNNPSDDNSSYTDNASAVAQLEEKDNEISTLNSEKSELKDQITKLQAQIDNTVVPDTSAYETLLSVMNLYLTELSKPESERDYKEIADTLTTIDDSQFSDTSLSLLATLRATTYPSIAEQHYETGHNLYSDGKYEEALVELSKALLLDPQDVDAVYFSARAYDRLGDKKNAITYYNKVISDFPNSKRVAEATDKLALIQ